MSSVFLSSQALSDYLTPSQICAKPVKPEETVKISLNDCLACSGCVTSAESVLISQQSTDDLTAELAKQDTVLPGDRKIFIASIDLRVALAFSVQHGVTLTQAYFLLSGFLRDMLGFQYVFDCSAAQTISILEVTKEVQDRLGNIEAFLNCYSSQKNQSFQLSQTPFIVGTCPGLVCYIEKVHPQLIPNLLTSPSVQHVQGALVKRVFFQLTPELKGKSILDIYHVCISPCYDRKIEALRFQNNLPIENSNVPLVDCVITYNELHRLMEQRNYPFDGIKCISLKDEHDIILGKEAQNIQIQPTIHPCDFGFGISAITSLNSRFPLLPFASGGYIETIISLIYKSLQKQQQNQQMEPNQHPFSFPWKRRPAYQITRRNTTNAVELVLENNPDYNLVIPQPITLGTMFGFRNLQTLINRIKTHKLQFVQQNQNAIQSSSSSILSKPTILLPLTQQQIQTSSSESDQLNKPFFYPIVDVQACPGACLGGFGLPKELIQQHKVDIPVMNYPESLATQKGINIMQDILNEQAVLQWPDEYPPLFIDRNLPNIEVTNQLENIEYSTYQFNGKQISQVLADVYLLFFFKYVIFIIHYLFSIISHIPQLLFISHQHYLHRTETRQDKCLTKEQLTHQLLHSVFSPRDAASFEHVQQTSGTVINPLTLQW
ncbi:MAG: nuclear prelamin A recognition factor-like [Streblomastix strix]|uniref:Nuclear prelamin A recognition factor-like n=1 Tax=Streblomastix strix TaxID=222440 RepID=A0A5J4VI78_9EUKA|nr:MAG: nuclear prelamin A recognition factor-like [Streblomastix strix]